MLSEWVFINGVLDVVSVHKVLGIQNKKWTSASRIVVHLPTLHAHMYTHKVLLAMFRTVVISVFYDPVDDSFMMAHLGSSVVVGEAPVNRTQPLSLVVVMMIHLEWATLGYRFLLRMYTLHSLLLP